MTPGERDGLIPSNKQNLEHVRSEVRWVLGPKNPAPLNPQGRGVTKNCSLVNYAGTTTTKRRGSSPSERVLTDGLSVKAS
jgi:hypothetical protein